MGGEMQNSSSIQFFSVTKGHNLVGKHCNSKRKEKYKTALDTDASNTIGQSYSNTFTKQFHQTPYSSLVELTNKSVTLLNNVQQLCNKTGKQQIKI